MRYKYIVPGAILVAVGAFALSSFMPEHKVLPVFRDLNKNGKMDVYEDSSKPMEDRITDLISQMNVAEKAGMMFINGVRVNADGSLDDTSGTGMFAFAPQASKLIDEKKLNHFNIWAAPRTVPMATWYNNIQKYAEQKTRLGIPITLASDPRHYFSNNIFAMAGNDFSQWPEQLGFAAVGDENLMSQFAEIARKEYMAVGIREALHPMADLATEPRWPRVSGTFGEDAQLSAKLISAYIEGFQGGPKLTTDGVACMTKHFAGGGPQKEGLDPHFEFQKGQVYPGKNFNYHLIPFEAAFKVNTAAIMPYYGVPTGQSNEDVAFSFNKEMITGLLRTKYKYDGVVCTDWGLITDTNMGGVIWPARAWGVEKLSQEDRVLKAIDAGVDQFGGESCAEHVLALVKAGKLSEKRLDVSVRRLLRVKFELGLFDNPYVDAAAAAEIVGKAEYKKAGEVAQRRSLTLLKNERKALPLKEKIKIYVQNIDPKVAGLYATVVDKPEQADFAIIRINTPWVPVETKNMFARGFHHGDLDFKGGKKDSIIQLLKTVPTIVDIYIDRPAVIPEISQFAKGLIADYGASDAAVLDVIFGKAKPEGKLPFELPSSMEAVRNQKEDLPHDSKDPLYAFGFGLKYE